MQPQNRKTRSLTSRLSTCYIAVAERRVGLGDQLQGRREGGIVSRHQNPLKRLRVSHGPSIRQLADACRVTEAEVIRVEDGESRIPGELRDYLTEQGESVSWLASEQSEHIAKKSK